MPAHFPVRPIILATRPSALALRQTDLVAERIREKWPEVDIRILPIRSEADRRPDESINRFGDKGVFVARLERALLDGEANAAVHSLKDMPAAQAEVRDRRAATAGHPGPEGLCLRVVAHLPAEDPRDVVVARDDVSLEELPPRARVGTSSLRRRLQLRQLRPDLDFVDIRGNVDTRLRKVDEGEYDAVVLAAAGLVRMGLATRITEYLDPAICLPAPGQGIIAIQCRPEDELCELLAGVDDPETRTRANMERGLARALGADCNTPLGALAEIGDARVVLSAALSRPDGSLVRVREEGALGDEDAVIARVKQALLA